MLKMLTLKSTLIVILCQLSNLDFLSCADGPCFSPNSCQCVFSSGATIDLSKFHSHRPLTVKASSLAIMYAPCLDAVVWALDVKDNPCEAGVSVCILNNTRIFDGGSKDELKFASTSQDANVTATFTKSGWTTVLNIDCNKDVGANESLIFEHYDTITNKVTLGIMSSSVCIGFNSSAGYGFFSSLFMVILLGAAIYFIGGAILLKFLRGADGVEMIPNYEFWRNFPQTCKSWFNNILDKIRGNERVETYENI